MTGSALARAKSVAEPRGDAGNVAPLDLTGLPTAARSGSSLRIGLDIASAKDLGAAVSSPSTDAYWLVLWKAHDRVEYAGLRVGSDGEPEFFGGDAPVGIEASGAALTETLARQLYAAYPAKFALHGSVDAAHGRVRIDLPLAQFHLGAGDTLRRLQAFTFTGMTSQRTPYTMLTGVDSSPARVVALR
jgi:hypothetical protein